MPQSPPYHVVCVVAIDAAFEFVLSIAPLIESGLSYRALVYSDASLDHIYYRMYHL